MKKLRLKVPMVMQMEALECGAASLAMVLAYYGKWVALSEVRARLGVSRDGVSMKALRDGARSYGLSCKATRVFPKSIPEKATLPCIAYWDMKHYVVITGYSEKHVYINNPASGAARYTWDEFNEHYSCVVLCLEPAEGFVADGKQASIFSFVKGRLKGAGGVLAFIAIAGVLGALIGVLSPKVSQAFIDQVLGNGNTQLALPLLIILTVAAILQLVLGLVQTLYLNNANAHFDIKTNDEFTRKILRLPLRFYSQRTAGDLMARQSANTLVTGTLLKTIAPLLVNAVSLVVYAVVMFSISIPLACIGIATTLLNTFIAFYISKRRIEINRVVARDRGTLAGVTSGILDSMETAKASGLEKRYFIMWAGEQSCLVAAQARSSKLNIYLGSVPGLLTALANALIIILGVMLIMQGELTAGGLVAMQSFVSMFFGPVEALLNASQVIQEMRTDMERIEDVMDNPDDAVFLQDEASQSRERLRGAIEIRDLTFGYSAQSDPLIQDFSLALKPGQSVALVGGSGSGKSTVARLVSGLYQPWSGSILYDGRPLFAIHRSTFTGSLAVVDQDITFIKGSVADALRFGHPQASEDDIVRAAQDAQMYEVIMKREGGFESDIGNEAKDFSGGQRQQLEIARALAGNPAILILDEATSALDAQTEKAVMDAIKARGITVVFVAHRLSTIRDADEIIVFDRGQAIERGTHQSLMQLRGSYYRLICAND